MSRSLPAEIRDHLRTLGPLPMRRLSALVGYRPETVRATIKTMKEVEMAGKPPRTLWRIKQ